MQGVEGQIFGPMARTYAYALLGAIVATFTVTPVMSSILLPERVNEVETFLVRHIRRGYLLILPLVVRRHYVAALSGLGFLAVCGLLGLRLGTEFLPKLEEGNLWIRALLPPTITLEAGMDSVARMRNIIKSYGPVETVFSMAWRPCRGALRAVRGMGAWHRAQSQVDDRARSAALSRNGTGHS
jgi:cobalt-zinc-cadmium resistance protein CzcA